jgi:serine/threonine protein kinase
MQSEIPTQPSLPLISTMPAFHVHANLLHNRERGLDDIAAGQHLVQLDRNMQPTPRDVVWGGWSVTRTRGYPPGLQPPQTYWWTPQMGGSFSPASASHRGLPRERQPPEPPEFIAGTLVFMAPEQTGRVNRSIDSRSDLYSLGFTFYEMLTR